MKNNTTKTVIFTLIGLIGFIVAMSAQRFVRQSQAEQAQMRAELNAKTQDEDFQQQLAGLAESQQQLSQQFSNVLSQLPNEAGDDQNESNPDNAEPDAADAILIFPESEIVKVETAFYSYDDPEKIAGFIDGMRSLEVSLTDKDAAEMLDTENKGCISFTAADGTVHDYYYTQDHYLVYGDVVYYVEDLSPLINVMDK